MKPIVILWVILFVQASSIGYSQKLSISKSNATLEEILIDINKQTGYYYSASYAALQNAKCITINVKNADLDEVLDLCFKDQYLMYSIKGNIILIKKIGIRNRVVKSSKSPKKSPFVPTRKIFTTECELV
jgi:hypothetical protein